MIRNIFITQNGISLVKLNFGECHSLGNNEDLVTGFLCALDSFSKEVTGSTIKSMYFDEYKFHFFKDEDYFDLLYVFITEILDDPNEVDFKIRKIASIFAEKYADAMKDFYGEISKFDDFKSILIDMNLAKKNCGGLPECTGCPNSVKTLNVIDTFQVSKKGFLRRFKSIFKRKKMIMAN
jgi:hypothetical protein